MAQLELSVVLNLANFRTQLGKLAQASAAYYYPINLTIDKQAFKKQLAALGNIKTTLNINDSQIEAARARVGTLNKSLATLRRATSTPIEIKLKYVEVGKPPSAAAGQIGQAVSGRVRADQAVAALNQKQAIAARNMLKAADVPVSGLGKSRSLEAYRKSIVDGMTNAGKESIAGLAQGLKNGQSAIGQAAKTVGDEGVRAIKATLGIKSPSEVFRRIGQFSVDGLEIGFLSGLKDFKSKSVAEIRKIVALMRLELAKVSNIGALGSSSTGSLRQQLVGQRAYTSPIGPLPMGSRAPWAQGTAGQFGGSGYEPRMVSRPYGQPYPAAPGSFLQFSRSAGQSQGGGAPPPARTPGSFLGFSQRATQVTQVAQRQGGGSFPSDNMMGRSSAVGGPSTPLSLDYYKNAVKYSEALKVANASMRNFSASQIPLIGGIKNLAGEFGQAAKQVLLYGTAYKGLAFLTSLPGQILNAAKSQQQFTNGLKVATQDTGTFAKELLYVDNVQRAFGLNLETTRTGFTRLYASMAPTGFDSGSIEKLFTGISAATASLQLTPDKAERVIYAFGQMASKGQIMAEELKGQLGDVLPGALAIFAKSAGMSVKEFSKAMEDGEFVGERFREVFAKVSDELINRFGTGAQAAGRSLQGLINTVGGDFQRTLESFAPLANSAAQAILGPLGGSLKQLALSAQIATGEIERVFMQLKESQQNLKDLQDAADTDGIITAKEAEQIRAAAQNVAALTAKYKSLQQAASDPAIAKQAQDITKFTEELGKAGTFVMNVAKAIGGMLSPVLNFLGTNLTTVISLITSFYIGFQTARLAAMALMGVLLLYRTLSAILGFGPAALGANALATAFNGLGIAATGAQVKVIGLRLALTALVASTVIGAVVGGIMLIAGAFANMRDRANEASQSSRDAAKAAIDAAQTGGVAQAAMSVQTILGESRKGTAARKALEGVMARSTKEQRAGKSAMSLTMEESVALKGSSLTEGMVKPAIDGKPQMHVPSKGDAAAIIRQFGSFAGQQDLNLREAKSALATAQKVAKEIGLDRPTPGATTPETPEDDPKAKAAREKAAREAEKLASQNQQRAIELSNHENDLDKINFDRKIQLDDSAFEHERSLIDALNEYRLSGLNDMQARQEKVVQDLKKIQLDAVDTVRKATQKAQEAQLNVVTAQRTAAAAGTGAPSAPILPSPTRGPVSPRVGSSFQGFPVTSAPGESRAYRNGTHEGYDFATPIGTALSYAIGGVVKSINKVGSGNAGKTLEVVLDNGIIGMSMHLSEVLIEAGQRFTAGQLLAKTGDTGAGPAHLHQESAPHAYKSGQAGASLAYLNIGKGKAASGASFRMETKQQTEGFDLIEEKAKASAAIELQRIEMQRAVELAYIKTASVIKANIDAIFPVEQQKLDLRLQQMRQSLLMQGMPEEYINYEMNRAAAMEESAMATQNMETSLANAKTELAVYNDVGKKGVELTIEQQVRMGLLKKAVEGYEAGLASLTNQQKAYNIAALESAIASIKNADALKAQQDAIQLIDGNVESATGSYKNFIKEVARGGDAKEALKKFQESITDQVLTVFLDYSFKPVEEFFKNSLNNMFGLPTAEKLRQDELKRMDAQLKELQKSKELQVNIDKNVATLTPGGAPAPDTTTPPPLLPSVPAVPPSPAAATTGPIALPVISFSPSAATAPVAAASKELNTALNANITGAITNVTKQTNTEGPKFSESLGKTVGAIGIAAGSIMGIAAGLSQIKEGGTSNVLGGIGSVLMSLGGAVGGFAGFFKGANGGVAGGGWKPFPVTAFANGGMVNGPTLGLVGEGKYNEAIVPLPDGRSIPVQMKGPSGGGLREAMSGNNGKASGSPILNMSFQSTNINGVEYVSRDQLEAAMATTRKQAAKDGANRGMSMTLDKLQQSPQTRNRLGMR